MTPTPKAPIAQRLQGVVLVAIVLLVGTMAGAASFTHVHDWTISNSPSGTPDWFGWANAVISELIPMAALIIIGQRRRTGGSIGYPMFLLVAAVALSLTAQLAVAEPTVFGWMVSALPALAFFALSKLVFTTTRPTNEVRASAPATIAPAPSIPDTATARISPVANEPSATKPVSSPPHQHWTPAKTTPAPVDPEPVPADTTAGPSNDPVRPAQTTAPIELLSGARIVADAHRQAHGEPITAGQLAVRLRVPTPTAQDILTKLNQPQTVNSTAHNGAPLGAAR